MKTARIVAALTAIFISCLAPIAHAGCVIAPDQKSINVVADNPSSDEKNCAVKCQVDTKIGVVQVACGGNTPPLAKDHSLCAFDKSEPWYNKVVSAEDSCKAVAGSTPLDSGQPGTAGAKQDSFTCKISTDGKSVDAMIANPYGRETSCQVDCSVSTTQAGTTFVVSCGKNVAPGVGQVVVCSHSFDKGRLIKMVGGKGTCINPEPPAEDAAKDKDDDVDVQSLANDPAKLREYIRKQMSPEGRETFDRMNKQ
jgi:hypothetical protein